MRLRRGFYLSLWLIVLVSNLALAQSGRAFLRHDRAYEQELRDYASVDQTLTPRRVLRWLLQLNGQASKAPSPTEFRPVVTVHDSDVRVIASIAYRF